MTPPARSAREPSSSVEVGPSVVTERGEPNTPRQGSAGGGGDPLAEVCEALDLARSWAKDRAYNGDSEALDLHTRLKAALATLRRARVVAFAPYTLDTDGTVNGGLLFKDGKVIAYPTEVAAQRWGCPVTPLIAFEEPER